jgi:hypothetical protein
MSLSKTFNHEGRKGARRKTLFSLTFVHFVSFVVEL